MNSIAKAITFAVLCLCQPASAATIHVSPGGDDLDSGDENSPLATVGEALARSAAGDTILLADGLYAGDGNRDLVLPAHPVLLRSTSGLPEACIMDCGGTATTSHHGFTVNAGQDTTSVIQGISIRNGWGDASAIAIDAVSSLKVTDCILADGHGPAITCAGGYPDPTRLVDPVLRRCRFENNEGGGFQGTFNVSPLIADCQFRDNSAVRGGAVFMGGFSRGTMERCLFERNTATESGGAVSLDYEQNLTINDCVFRDNSAPLGGAIDNPLGWFKKSLANKSLGSFNGCRFERNTAEKGGVAYTEIGGDLRFVDCTFIKNSASVSGGVTTEVEWNRNSYTNCLFVRNSAPVGGALYVGDAQPSSSSTVQSCTFVGNSAPAGGTIAMVNCSESEYPNGSILAVSHSIIAYGAGGSAVLVMNGSGPRFSCSDIRDNQGGDWTGSIAAQIDLRGNFSANPCFCAMADDDYRLTADSWCLAGNHPWGCDDLVGAFGEGCPKTGCSGTVGNDDDGHDGQGDVPDTLRPQPLLAHPNPFNPSTSITFVLDRSEPVEVAVFDLQGRRVRVLENGRLAAGAHVTSWNGTDARGLPVPTGTYFVQWTTARSVETLKLTLLK